MKHKCKKLITSYGANKKSSRVKPLVKAEGPSFIVHIHKFM